MKGDRKLGHMGVISFQNFLRGAQRDLPNRNTDQLGIGNDEEIAKLYEKMAHYTSRYEIIIFSYFYSIYLLSILTIYNDYVYYL